MLKKAGFVTATAAGLMLVGGTAFAATAPVTAAAPEMPAVQMHGDHHGPFTFWDAFDQFNEGGGALGYGAASLVSGAFAGIATTPQLIVDSLLHHHH